MFTAQKVLPNGTTKSFYWSLFQGKRPRGDRGPRDLGRIIKGEGNKREDGVQPECGRTFQLHHRRRPAGMADCRPAGHIKK